MFGIPKPLNKYYQVSSKTFPPNIFNVYKIKKVSFIIGTEVILCSPSHPPGKAVVGILKKEKIFLILFNIICRSMNVFVTKVCNKSILQHFILV